MEMQGVLACQAHPLWGRRVLFRTLLVFLSFAPTELRFSPPFSSNKTRNTLKHPPLLAEELSAWSCRTGSSRHHRGIEVPPRKAR